MNHFFCTKQTIYYLFVAFDRSHLEGGVLQFVLTIYKIIKKLDAIDFDLWSSLHPE